MSDTPDHLHNALQSIGAFLLQRDRELTWMRDAQAWMDTAEDTLLDLDLCANDRHVTALIERRPRRDADAER